MDPEGWSWDTRAELLAAVAELVDYGNRLFLQANSKKGTKPPKPIQIARPGRQAAVAPDAPPRPQASADEIARFFGGAKRTGD